MRADQDGGAAAGMPQVFGQRGGRCTAGWLTFGVLVGRCGEAATVLVRHGCVHEHVRDLWLCQFHASDSEAQCTACLGLIPGSHLCPMAKTRLEAASDVPGRGAPAPAARDHHQPGLEDRCEN